MNTRRAFLLALAAINTAVAQLNTTTPTAALLTDPPTNLPTKTPTNPPTIPPTSSPSMNPTVSTSPTSSPSSSPSSLPSMRPTLSSMPSPNPSTSPSLQPTVSKQPSLVPTVSAVPSGSPSEHPTLAPIIPPSAAPSMEESIAVVAEYNQLLDVSNTFDESDLERFCRIYQSYTDNFGYDVGSPQITTTCKVSRASMGFTRRTSSLWNRLRRMLQEDSTKILTMEFFMTYSTVIGGYNLENYNTQFTEYVNLNTTKVLVDMQLLKLPVLNVSKVIELAITSPTMKPTLAPQTEAPVPRSEAPSMEPSDAPFIDIPDVSQDSFVLGLSLGLSGAFAVAAFGFIYYRHGEKQKQKDELIQLELSGDNNDMDVAGTAGIGVGDSMEVKVSDHNGGVLSQDDITNDGSENDDGGGGQGIVRDTNASFQLQSSPPRLNQAFDIESGAPGNNAVISSSVGVAPMVHPMAYATMDSIFSQQASQAQAQAQQYQDSFRGGAPTNLMMADASFSSDSDDELGNPSAFDGSHDELDNYKNNDLEILRNTVEESVEDVEGMLSLAMTRALTEGEDAVLPWGSEDSGSIEASCLFETYDWLKRNENSPLLTRYEFFQEVINGLVVTVLFGLMYPLEAAQLAHGVATVIGLPLLNDLPKQTLVITGMRKTTDVDRGQHVILAAFERFGPIEQAAIAPNNRGFGFVRFSKPKSVQRALEKYRVAEIEIQNVSVSIKTLENTTPARG